MKNKLLKKISVILLALCLVIPVAAIMVMKSDAADTTLEEQVYEEGYTKSIVDLVKVKKQEDGTDIDGDATNGGTSDLEQMRNYIVEKTDAFYRTQGVKYEYDSTNACYYVTANQSCSAGITKAEGTLTVLSTYNDATNGEATVTTVAENAFLDCTDVTTAVMPTVTTLETNAFKGCSNLETAVIKNRFTLSADSFPGSDMAVDICVLGSEEPALAMQDASSNTINAGLSGAVYLQNTSGGCETWKYNESGTVVKAQHRHTYGEDNICTNENCKIEAINGVAFEKNYFPARSASSITVEKVASYTDANLKTETNVAKITTVSNSMKIGDFVLDLPQDVTEKLQLRILIPDSDGIIYFRTVGTNGTECKTNIADIGGANGVPTEKENVWLDYTVDLTNTSKAYKDRLAVLTSTANVGDATTFYVAYAIDQDKIQEKLASDLTLDYLADFDSSLYENIITDGITSNATLETEWLPSYEGEKGVMKVKVTGTSNWVDFGINLPKSHTGTYTLRMYISDATDLAYLGTRNANGSNWGNKADANASYTKNAWQSITVSGNDEGYNGATIVFAGNDATSAETLEVYLAWIYNGSSSAKEILAAELPADYYVADFDSALYQDIISTGLNTGDTMETEWLSSYEGEEGVMRVKVTGSGSWKDFDITLPKSYTETYTLRIYVSTNTNVYQVGTRTSAGAWGKWAGSYTTGQWQSIKVTDSKDELYDRAKINLAGYNGSETFEVYLAWILDGCNNITTAEETWRANTTSAVKTTLQSTLGDGYLADFRGADYASLVFGCNDIARDPKSITASYLESHADVNQVSHDGVLKVDVVCDNTGDFLVELPKSITQDSIKLRYAVVYGDGAKDANDYL